MFDIGESLAAARQAQGLRLADVEALTSIRVAQLAALEAERFDEFPGRAYARAFLRSYSRALGLDADLFVLEFESRFPELPEPLPFVIAGQRWRPSLRAVTVVTVAAAAVAFVAWAGTSSNTTPKLPAVAAAGSAPAAVEPGPARPPDAVARPAAKAASGGRLVIRSVRGACWLEIRSGGPTGRLLYEATLAQGGSVSFATPHLWIRFGAPGNVVAMRGGRLLRGLSSLLPVDLTA